MTDVAGIRDLVSGRTHVIVPVREAMDEVVCDEVVGAITGAVEGVVNSDTAASVVANMIEGAGI